MLIWVLAGCGNVETTRSDAAVPDASSICDPTGTFDKPVPLTGFNTAGNEAVPRLTTDELELYFSGNLVGASDSDIYRAQRSTTSQPFGTPAALTRVNTAANDGNPVVSNDGLMLFFESNRVSGEGYHLYVSARTSRVVEFDSASEIANVNSATITDSDDQPFVTADGNELWFSSNRPGGARKERHLPCGLERLWLRGCYRDRCA